MNETTKNETKNMTDPSVTDRSTAGERADTIAKILCNQTQAILTDFLKVATTVVPGVAVVGPPGSVGSPAPGPSLALGVVLSGGQGTLIAILPEDTAFDVGQKLLGDQTEEGLGELTRNALGTLLTTVVDLAGAELSQKLGLALTAESVSATSVDLSQTDLVGAGFLPDQPVVEVPAMLSREGAENANVTFVMPARLVAGEAASGSEGAVAPPTPGPAEPPPVPPQQAAAEEFSPAQHAANPVEFQDFDAVSGEPEPSNFSLVLDIGLNITVELGRTHMEIKEVLDLGPGSVVVLDKLAGDPVDLIVNDRLFARGEVVVIDENFGIRITDILTPLERLETLN